MRGFNSIVSVILAKAGSPIRSGCSPRTPVVHGLRVGAVLLEDLDVEALHLVGEAGTPPRMGSSSIP